MSFHWFKHDTNANMDAKLQEVLLDYGLEGYGLYWYCIELITDKISKNNLTFELEHDSRIIARNTGSTVQKVEEMIRRFVDLGLFDQNNGKIRCLTILKRLDCSMTSNPQMRDFIKTAKNHHDDVMIIHDNVMLDNNIIDNNIINNNKHTHVSIRKDESNALVKSKVDGFDLKQVDQKKPRKRSEPKFEQCDMDFAEDAYQTILARKPTFRKPNLKSWANQVRIMRETDGRNMHDAAQVFVWAQRDDFWCDNILSIKKLRDQYDALSGRAGVDRGLMPMNENKNPKQRVRDSIRNIDDTNW